MPHAAYSAYKKIGRGIFPLPIFISELKINDDIENNITYEIKSFFDCLDLYPNTTSSIIIRLKPNAKNTVPMLECLPVDISGINSSTTTYSIAPAAKLSRNGRAGTTNCAARIVSIAPSGSTIPERTPLANAVAS